MTPQEKAKQLFERFNKEGLHQISSVINRFIRKEIIKQCALIAVDEILNAGKDVDEFSDSYWQQVRKEILSL